MSHLEDTLLAQIRAVKLPMPTRELVFAKPRKFRFDFAWVDHMLAVEVEGGIWTNGAHNRGKHFIQDCDKYNQASLLGWRLLRFTEQHIKSGEALDLIEFALQSGGIA